MLLRAVFFASICSFQAGPSVCDLEGDHQKLTSMMRFQVNLAILCKDHKRGFGDHYVRHQNLVSAHLIKLFLFVKNMPMKPHHFFFTMWHIFTLLCLKFCLHVELSCPSPSKLAIMSIQTV